MSAWLLAHQAVVQSYALLGSFAAVGLWETVAPRRTLVAPLGARWFHQIALTASGWALVRLCLPLAALSMAGLAEQEGWGLFNQWVLPPWWSCVAGVIALDFGNYMQHRAFHAVPMLWRLHRIHHCDLDVDCGTAIRHHPVEALATGVVDIALVAALGVSPLAVVVFTALTGAAAVFNHGNVALAVLPEKWLRRFVVTPDMHRIHHSMAIGESNTNFANVFSWWDRLFATYQRDPADGHERMELGIAGARHPRDVTLWKLFSLPLQPLESEASTAARVHKPHPSP